MPRTHARRRSAVLARRWRALHHAPRGRALTSPSCPWTVSVPRACRIFGTSLVTAPARCAVTSSRVATRAPFFNSSSCQWYRPRRRRRRRDPACAYRAPARPAPPARGQAPPPSTRSYAAATGPGGACFARPTPSPPSSRRAPDAHDEGRFPFGQSEGWPFSIKPGRDQTVPVQDSVRRRGSTDRTGTV